MAIIQITIGPTSATPVPAETKHGDTVKFVLSGRTDTVAVTFTNNTPLAQSVNGSLTSVPSITLSPALTTQSYPISPTAPKGQYSFTFPQAGPPPKGEDRDQPTSAGEIDVTTDPEA
jgi:hypothetical protein